MPKLLRLVSLTVAIGAVIGLAALAGCSRTHIRNDRFDFEGSPVGKPPPFFAAGVTGDGGASSWIVQDDATAPAGPKVLVQTSADATSYRFPVCTFDSLQAKDLEVSVQFKAISGKVDQAAGVIARFKDKDNYYVVRANALEDNVRLYKVEAAKRSQFAGADVKVTPGEWHSLKLSVRGGHFVVWFDGRKLFEADDATFKEPGRVGLWTKADSVTEFDDLRIESYDAK